MPKPIIEAANGLTNGRHGFTIFRGFFGVYWPITGEAEIGWGEEWSAVSGNISDLLSSTRKRFQCFILIDEHANT